jgi:chromosome partitioning protein
MAKIFCVANQKGGVGKTTTAVNLAAGLAKIGQRVLMIDLDPQGNATMGSGVDKRALELSVYDVLGANRELSGAEIELVTLERRNERLKGALKAADADYDFVLVDCPPSLSMLTLNGLCAAHGVVVPMQCEYFALEGLTDLVKEHFGDKVFDTVIPRNVRLAEAPSYGVPGVVFDPAAKGSKAFIEFAREMVRRIKKM